MGRSLLFVILSLVVLSLLNLVPVFAEAPSEAATESTIPPIKKKAPDLPFIDPFAQTAQVEVVADQMEYSKTENKILARGNAVLNYQGTTITADYAEVDPTTKQAVAKGHVKIFEGKELRADGDEIYFDFENKTGSFPGGTCFSNPWWMKGKDIQQVAEGQYKISDAVFTTCTGEIHPYEIHASEVTVRSGDKLEATNAKIYAGHVPIFWLPYVLFPLQDNSMPFQIRAGHNSDDGYYIELLKGFSLSRSLYGKLLADWRSKRGFGGGAILEYNYGPMSQGSIIGYWTQDKDAPSTAPQTKGTESENPYDVRTSRDRGRLTWKHRSDLDPYTFLVLRYHRVADEYFLQDFFEKEHRGDIEPHSFATFTKNTERMGFMVHGQKRMNNFEKVVERLPELRIDYKNQPFVRPWLFYENQNSFVNLRKRYGRINMDEHAVRFDSFHEWSLPLRWHQIKITPYGNARETFYSRQLREEEGKLRTALGYGLDLRTQYYRKFDVSGEWLGMDINQLRHIAEPYFKIQSTHPVSASDEKFAQYDGIDELDNRDTFTFGLENRIQTKRVVQGQMKRVDIVSLNTFLSYSGNPRKDSDVNDFSVLNQEVVLRPYMWLQYEARMKFDLEGNKFQTFNQDLIFRKNRIKFLLGQRYVNDPAIFGVSDELETGHQFVIEGSYKLNDRWEAHGYTRWDAEDGAMEEYQIGMTRDWGCVLFDFGFNERKSDIRKDNNREVYFNLTLKDYPEFTLRTGQGRASFGAPRIGETVAGANQFGGYVTQDTQDLQSPVLPY
ncbi:MAG: LPS-assembly protein LptD [Candidatus Omnitrophota bacterium]